MARKGQGQDPIPALEWISATLGLLVVLAILAVLALEIGHGGMDDVPLLEARVEAVNPVPGGHVAGIVVANGSGQTAAAVQVEGKLGAETATTTIDYVPGHSEARGGLMFKGDPRRGVELAVLGYELP